MKAAGYRVKGMVLSTIVTDMRKGVDDTTWWKVLSRIVDPMTAMGRFVDRLCGIISIAAGRAGRPEWSVE